MDCRPLTEWHRNGFVARRRQNCVIWYKVTGISRRWKFIYQNRINNVDRICRIKFLFDDFSFDFQSNWIIAAHVIYWPRKLSQNMILIFNLFFIYFFFLQRWIPVWINFVFKTSWQSKLFRECMEVVCFRVQSLSWPAPNPMANYVIKAITLALICFSQLRNENENENNGRQRTTLFLSVYFDPYLAVSFICIFYFYSRKIYFSLARSMHRIWLHLPWTKFYISYARQLPRTKNGWSHQWHAYDGILFENDVVIITWVSFKFTLLPAPFLPNHKDGFNYRHWSQRETVVQCEKGKEASTVYSLHTHMTSLSYIRESKWTSHLHKFEFILCWDDHARPSFILCIYMIYSSSVSNILTFDDAEILRFQYLGWIGSNAYFRRLFARIHTRSQTRKRVCTHFTDKLKTVTSWGTTKRLFGMLRFEKN